MIFYLLAPRWLPVTDWQTALGHKLAHWRPRSKTVYGRDWWNVKVEAKWSPFYMFYRRQWQIRLFWRKLFYFDAKFTSVCSYDSSGQWVSIAYDHNLVPSKGEAIIWTNIASLVLDESRIQWAMSIMLIHMHQCYTMSIHHGLQKISIEEVLTQQDK